MRFPTCAVVGLALPLALAACGTTNGLTTELEQLRRTTPAGTPFTQALSREYLAFSEAERAEYDWHNSQYFARKGLAAAKGQAVEPVNPREWGIDKKLFNLTEFADGRQRLMNDLVDGRARNPKLAATAQVKFDCWVEQAEEGWQTTHIEACRNDFYNALKGLEVRPVAAAPTPTPAPVAMVESFQVFFDFDRAVIRADARPILDEVARTAKRSGAQVTVVGHTDTSGSVDYNQKLSLRRARVVKDYLTAQGIPADRVVAEGVGKTDLLVPTPDGVREAQNRRTVVRFGQ